MRTPLILAALLLAACADKAPDYPLAEKRPTELEAHGDVRVDNYYWLRERDNPEVLAYLEAENAYAESVLAATAGLRERLIGEMKARIKDDEASAPYRHGDYYYYYRYDSGREFPIHCRRKGSLDAPEEILLDVNVIARNEPYADVQNVQVSPDHTKLAYLIDTVGRRFYELRIVDLESGEHIADVIPDMTSNYVWANDSETIVYVKQDPTTLRWFQAYAHDTGGVSDTLIYEETDETYNVSVYRALSGRFVYIESASTVATEVRYLPADAPDTEPLLFLPRERDHEYFLSDGGDRFYVLSNRAGPNFELFEMPLDDIDEESWRVVIPHRDNTLLEDFQVFAGHVAVAGTREGVSTAEILDRSDGSVQAIEFDEDVFLAEIGDNYEYDTNTFRYDYESLTRPPSVYDYDVVGRKATLVWQKEVPGGFDDDDYHAERLFANARDGTPIPVSLVYRKGIELDGKNPLLQHGYGSYGSSSLPWFSLNRLSLLDRGFVFAIAHIRGGSEMGRQWYYDGRQRQKKNTFTDFIDVSRFLVAEGYTSPAHLYAYGASAGGLLMGAVINMAPELYNGVLARVPFVDVITTMLDDSIPLTSSEWDEWGDPRNKVFYDYMLSYSPYDQVTPQAYPNLLVTAGLHDSQVQYWEPAKWVAKLRELKTDDNKLLLVTDMQAGHSGKTGRYRSLEDDALYYAFYLSLEGIVE